MLHGIRARLLALVFATVLPFAALVGGGLWSQWRSDQEQALRSAHGQARVLAARVDDQLGNFDSLLIGLGKALSLEPGDVEANDEILRRAKAELPSYVSNLKLFSLDGHAIGRSSGGNLYVGDRGYFQEIVAGKPFAIGEPLQSRLTDQWVIAVARPVKDRDGNIGAVLVLSFLLDQFQEGLAIDDLPRGGVVQVISEKGIVITRNVDPAEWVGRDLSDQDRVARHRALRDVSEIVRWADGVERITGSSTAHLVPWLVSVGLPKDVAFAKLSSRLTWGVSLSLLALTIALGLAWLLSGRITLPLRQLSRDVFTLAAGDLAHRTQIKASDEIGALATTFNTMAATLDERHRDLISARETAATEAAKRAALEEQERRAKETLAAIIDTSPVAIVCSDPERRTILWNRAAERIFGYTAEETLGHPTKLVPPEGAEESHRLFQRAIRGEVIRDVEVIRRNKQGRLIDIELAATAIYKPDGTVWSVAWAYDDITDRKTAERQLSHLAHHDQLTGLPNRAALRNELEILLSKGGSTSVALFDLDGFKEVNDTLGHSKGDALLLDVAQRILRVAGGRAKPYRLGGDEFVLVVPDCGDPRVATGIVDAILKAISEPFLIDDQSLHIGASAGIGIAPHHGSNVDELIANTDFALYEAKKEGRTYRVFVPTLRAQAQAQHDLQQELRRAFEQNEFELFFQPQIRLHDGAVIGAEALLRWRHPVHGIVGPGAFIETLADSAIAFDVGTWVLRDACGKASEWRRMGLPLDRISVNLFPCQSRNATLPWIVKEVLETSGLPADALELEITENVALNHENAIAPLQALHASGVKLAFDDFGTGYASLSYLTRFPVSRIKIDRSFVAKITDDARDAAIVRSLIAMAHNLGLAITAEGVETAEQAKFLLNENCEEAQGFLYSKPMTAQDFGDYLRARNDRKDKKGDRQPPQKRKLIRRA